MKPYQLIILLLTCCVLQLAGMAQSGNLFDPLKDDISEKLPKLSVLIDSALAYNPALKFNNLQISVNQGNLKSTRSQWTQNFGVQANYGYGTFDYIYNNSLGSAQPGTYTLSQSLNQYGVGAFLRIPFSDVVNRRNLINVAKAEVQQAQSLVATQQAVVREQVIRQYNDLILKQRLLRIVSKYLETARINMQMAEKGFTNGTLTVDDYSRVSEISARTETEFETARMDFLTSYQILEETVGMKFNLYYNEIPKE
jgi:outer membrane protein TolC